MQTSFLKISIYHLYQNRVNNVENEINTDL